MPELVSAEALGKLLGVSGQAVRKAHAAGRLSSIEGKFDPAVARIQWDANRKRRRSDPGRPPPRQDASSLAEASEATDGTAYWDAKTRREAAEASIAELKEAELRGELVRRAAVERALASRLVALRASLDALADRLAALVAAESDAQVCRRLLREEHRIALTILANASVVADPEEGSDGRA